MQKIKSLSFDSVRSIFIYSLISLLFAALVGIKTTPHMAFSTVTYLLLVFGLVQRKNKTVHVASMSTAIAFDFSLVLLLELQRQAIETTFTGQLSVLQHGHILASSTALLLYIPIVFLGIKLYQQSSIQLRKVHIFLGMTAFILRSVGFVLSFSIYNLEKNIGG